MYQAFSGKHVKLPKRFAKIAGRYANFIFIDVTMVIENRVFVKREGLKQCRLICSQN